MVTRLFWRYLCRMAQLLIVYHSRTGGSQQMAEAAFEGARNETETHLKPADQAGPDDLLAASGYLFCAPENLAAISGVMKDFFDRCYYPVLGRIEGRAYAQMVCAGSDGANAVRQIARIAQGWRLRAVQEPLILCTHAQTPEAILAPKTIPEQELTQCREIGQALAAGLAMGMF
jgi:multimeric flavodoxin WrbA